MPSVWRSNLYLLASFPVGIFTFCFFVTMLSVGVSLLIIWVGVPILIATVASTKFFAAGERRRAGWLLQEPIPSLYLPSHRRGMLGYLHTAVGDAAIWKDLLWLLILLPILGLAGFTLAVCAWGVALGMVFLPLWYWSVPNGVDYGLFTVDKLPEAFGMTLVGLVLLVVAAPLTRAAGYGVGALARGVLAPSERRRLMELERTRAGAVDAQAAELQRIERDLHDGAQARLVALAMDLGMAEERFDRDPEGARELVGEAREEAKRALAELRDLARGIRPGLLEERGLEAAVAALAARSPVPARATVDVPRRPPAKVESAAWFVVSEALANTAKHSGAQRATVWVTLRDGSLHVEVVDDGRGGADANGAGLRGLAQRVAALDGSLEVNSPPGGPTLVRAVLPCE